MKRIKSILFAIAMLLATPAFFTSCQEDAPEINYTMNVSVINDFTKVVEAINNGFLKNEEAIKKLTEAIDKMNADQQTKLQVIIDVLNSVNATLETKLAAIEAAMKAQTLTLESKLTLLETAIKNQTLRQEEMAGKLITAIENLQGDMQEKIAAIAEAINNVNTTLQSKLALIEAAIKAQTLSLEAKLALIEAAIKALPDYSSQLAAIQTAIENLPDYGDKIAAIEAAIKAMPNYNDKFDAVVAALNAMKAQIEALGTGQAGIVEAINNTTAAINSLIAAVNSGNTNAAAALAQIIQKLEELKEKIGNGGGSDTPVNFYSITLNDIKAKENKMIKGHEVKEDDLAAGKIFVYKTDKNRYGKMEMISVENTTDIFHKVILFRICTYNDDGSVYKSNENVKLETSYYLDLDEIKVFGFEDPFQGEDILMTMGMDYFAWGFGSNFNTKMAFYGW